MITKTTATCVLILFLFSTICSSAQSIVPSTLNTGGGVYTSAAYQFDWSIGEGASIASFQSNRNLIVTSGVLQPFTEKTGEPFFFILPWAKDELSVFPNPTYNILELDIKIAEAGLITMTVSDLLGHVVVTRQFVFDGTNNKQKIDLTGVVSGIYYLNVTMGGAPSLPVIRKGSFKILKL